MEWIASYDEIKAGKTTDVYFDRTRKCLEGDDLLKTKVTFEITVSSFPNKYPWAVYLGLEEVVNILVGKNIDVYSLSEGTIFPARDQAGVRIPVMIIEGEYGEFMELETPLLGFLCYQSGIGTASARVKMAAKGKSVLSFGVRRMHPAVTPVIDRGAWIGGCDGVSSILSGEKLGVTPSGTMPHALVMLTGGIVEATKSFDKHVEPEVSRVALIDTFNDEKFSAIMAAEAIDNLQAVRLDTPGSRKGSFIEIIQEVRWELDVRGFNHVNIFVSGGLNEKTVGELEAHVDGFGVGTYISNARTIDYAADIVTIEGVPRAKRGKMGGKKLVWQCEKCGTFQVALASKTDVNCSCGEKMISKLQQIIKNGEQIQDFPTVDESRTFVKDQIWNFNIDRETIL
ncbi:MAG: nicotinate phosphoribosyltransferase [Candidatus Heimdallarchaeota archaeon]|nr:nicotinate phosphoribosyltransferase [Candidatus Heimdallarchaeota archaeon]MCK5049425.1 nicotinate phosphoribosyltransferase [Candidatus Heimdallarchaeota archaeon]